MTSVEDNQMKIEESRQLKLDIENEFALVDQLLRQVSEFCCSGPVGDDPIMQAIDEIGKTMNEKFEDMKKVFDQAMDAFGEVINQMAKWLQKRLDELNEYKSKIKK